MLLQGLGSTFDETKMTEPKFSAVETLKEILRIVTQVGDNDRERLAAMIGPMLIEPLMDGGRWRTRYSSISPVDLGRLQISKELRVGDEVKILVTTGRGLPDLAHLQLRDGKWRLYSLLPQCPGCFGSGILQDDVLCHVCGAKGWGSPAFDF